MPHKDKSYPGLHEAIIDQATWNKAQVLLSSNTQGPRKRKSRVKSDAPLLAGILTDEKGVPFTPNHANKKGRRYRYYVEKGKEPATNVIGANKKGGNKISILAESSPTTHPRRKRIPAVEIEAAVKTAVSDLLLAPNRLMDTLHLTNAEDTARALTEANQLVKTLADKGTTAATILRPLLSQVICGKDHLLIRFDRAAFLAKLGLPHGHPITVSSTIFPDPEITVPLSIRTRGVEMKLIIPSSNGANVRRNPDAALIKAVARGYRWFQLLKTGAAPSVGAIAKTEGVTSSFITRTMRLAFLSPTLIQEILSGTQPPGMTVDWLMESGNVPVRWSEKT